METAKSQDSVIGHVQAIKSALANRSVGEQSALDCLGGVSMHLFPESDNPTDEYLHHKLAKHQKDWENAPLVEGEPRPVEAPVPVSSIADAVTDVLGKISTGANERKQRKVMNVLEKASLRGLVKAHRKRTQQQTDILRREMVKEGKEIKTRFIMAVDGCDPDTALGIFELMNKGALEEESARLNHCVGTDDHYINAINRRRTQIFSIRSLDGSQSQCTIEYDRRRHAFEQIRGQGDEVVRNPDLIRAMLALRTDISQREGQLPTIEDMDLGKDECLTDQGIYKFNNIPERVSIHSLQVKNSNFMELMARMDRLAAGASVSIDLMLRSLEDASRVRLLLQKIAEAQGSITGLDLRVNLEGDAALDTHAQDLQLELPSNINIHRDIVLYGFGDIVLPATVKPGDLKIENTNRVDDPGQMRPTLHMAVTEVGGQEVWESGDNTIDIYGYKIVWSADKANLDLPRMIIQDCEVVSLPDVMIGNIDPHDGLQVYIQDSHIRKDAWNYLRANLVNMFDSVRTANELPPIETETLEITTGPRATWYEPGSVSSFSPGHARDIRDRDEPQIHVLDLENPEHIKTPEGTHRVFLAARRNGYHLVDILQREGEIIDQVNKLGHKITEAAFEAYLEGGPTDEITLISDDEITKLTEEEYDENLY